MVLAGVFDASQRRHARLEVLSGTHYRQLGPVAVAWDAGADIAEGDGIAVWVDGFLLGAGADAAAVLGAWPAGAADTLARLRGAFTVVVWDARQAVVTIANDHMSLGACLLHGDGPVTTWATDGPTLLAALPVSPGPDEGVVSAWMAPLNPQGHATMLDGVERVGAGRFVTVSARGFERQRYWNPQYQPPVPATLDEAAGALRERLDSAIAARMDRERPTAVALSGGLDSTLVTSLAVAGHGPGSVRAYSATFPQWPRSDESERIRATRAHLGIDGCSFAPRGQGGLQLAIDVIRRGGFPPGGPGGLVELLALRQAADDGLHVVLDGQGGDEILGLSPFLLADRLRRGDPYGALRLLHRLVNLRNPAARSHARGLAWAYGLAPLLGLRVGRRRDWRQFAILAPLHPERERALRSSYDPLLWRTRSSGPLWWRYQRFRLVDGREQGGLADYLRERGLERGLRSPAPLMDPDLVEHVLGADPAPGWAHIDRRVARHAARDVLPRMVRANPVKANIGPFYLSLMSGPDAPAVDALLTGRDARIAAWVDPMRVAEHARRRPAPDDPSAFGWATARWRMVVAELWLRWLEDRESLDALAVPPPLAD